MRADGSKCHFQEGELGSARENSLGSNLSKLGVDFNNSKIALLLGPYIKLKNKPKDDPKSVPSKEFGSLA